MKTLILAAGLTLAAAPSLAESSGQTLYAGYCQACHQPNGQGTKPVFPALAGSPLVNGPAATVIERVLKGKSSMPPFKGQLDNTQIAAVITYIRSSWGNHASAVTPAQVAALDK